MRVCSEGRRASGSCVSLEPRQLPHACPRAAAPIARPAAAHLAQAGVLLCQTASLVVSGEGTHSRGLQRGAEACRETRSGGGGGSGASMVCGAAGLQQAAPCRPGCRVLAHSAAGPPAAAQKAWVIQAEQAHSVQQHQAAGGGSVAGGGLTLRRCWRPIRGVACTLPRAVPVGGEGRGVGRCRRARGPPAIFGVCAGPRSRRGRSPARDACMAGTFPGAPLGRGAAKQCWLHLGGPSADARLPQAGRGSLQGDGSQIGRLGCADLSRDRGARLPKPALLSGRRRPALRPRCPRPGRRSTLSLRQALLEA